MFSSHSSLVETTHLYDLLANPHILLRPIRHHRSYLPYPVIQSAHPKAESNSPDGIQRINNMLFSQQFHAIKYIPGPFNSFRQSLSH